jgi:hypothetical protein
MEGSQQGTAQGHESGKALVKLTKESNTDDKNMETGAGTTDQLSWECWQHVSNMSATCQNVNEYGNFCVRVPTPKFPRHNIFVSKISNTVPHTTSQKCRTLHFGVCRLLKIYLLK